MNQIKGGRAAKLTEIIDRDAESPIYFQLAEILREKILTGSLRPGEKLPSETDLVDTYEVSPMTVRRAINLLAAQDIISTAPGRGTFVKEVQLESAAFYLRDLHDLFNNTGATQVKLIGARFINADERIAAKLQIRLGERAIYIRRLLTVDGRPAYYHRGYLVYDPTRPVLESEFEVTDLKGLFHTQGNALIKGGDLNLEATYLTAEDVSVLQLPGPMPGMLLGHLFYDFNNQPLSWGWFVCTSTQLRLQTRIGFDQANGKRDERPR